MMVKDYLSDKYGERMVYQGGLKIYTTLDLDLQRAANECLRKDETSSSRLTALVAVDVTNGHIRSLIGGRNFATSNYNRVLLKDNRINLKPLYIHIDMVILLQINVNEEVIFELPNGDEYRPTDYGNEPIIVDLH